MDQSLSTIYAIAVLLPLGSFAVILLLAPWLGRFAAWLATSAILGAGLLSFLALGMWLNNHFPQPTHHPAAHAEAREGHQETGESNHKSAAHESAHGEEHAA